MRADCDDPMTPYDQASSDVRIDRWTDFGAADRDGWLTSGVHAIFREAAARWPDEPAAAAFTELWLGGYLRCEPDLALVALRQPSDRPSAPHPRVVGYLVASTADPLTDPRFSALDYFNDFAPELAAFPAHLHVNVAADCRGQRIGERLIDEISTILAARGCPGVHIVTGRNARNTGFYRRCGFVLRAESGARIFMGRRLGRRLQT